ncbi:peptidoglycan-binding domain-containing protein, partial [Methylobacterium sp. EM32]|uniref:peptidoglycan-binding domain-containing protein n=1 Tax=Methylobacterium sp. EM32 TaxID=3163481 RepID=UPI0033BD3540
AAPPPPPRNEAALQPEEWRQIQQALARSGHFAGKADGRPGEGTRAAIARYQRGLGAQATGRLTSAQIDRLLPPRPVKGPMAAR